MVFVLDRQKHPLMPTTPKRARLLLARGQAVVHRIHPFVIRLKDRSAENSALQDIALARIEQCDSGEVHHAVYLSEISHRGEQVHSNKVTQAQARRRRRWSSVRRLEVERVRFDTQLLLNPEIEGTDYQHGTLAGWEARTYLLIKYEYRCVYCGNTDVPFEVDHIRPCSRGGSHRISNLCLACHACNQAKGEKTAAEVNATSYKLVEALRIFRLPIGTWTGGRTRWNRGRFGIEKTHALDALCVGELAGVWVGKHKPLTIRAMGRGDHCRTLWTDKGFPRGYKMRQKMVVHRHHPRAQSGWDQCDVLSGRAERGRLPLHKRVVQIWRGSLSSPAKKARGIHRRRFYE